MPGPDNYTISIPSSPPPPTDLSSYSRLMHDHTKRQMEAQRTYPDQKAATGRQGGGGGSTSSSMTNGSVSPTDYQT